MHNKMHNNILFLKYVFLFISKNMLKSKKLIKKYYKKKKTKKSHFGSKHIIRYKLITFSRANARNRL